MGMPPSVAVATLMIRVAQAMKKRPVHSSFRRFSLLCCTNGTNTAAARQRSDEGLNLNRFHYNLQCLTDRAKCGAIAPLYRRSALNSAGCKHGGLESLQRP